MHTRRAWILVAALALIVLPSSAMASDLNLTVTPTLKNGFGVPYLFDFTASGTTATYDCGIPTFPFPCPQTAVIRAVQPPAACERDQGYLIYLGGLPGKINLWAGSEGPNRFCLILYHDSAAGTITDASTFVDIPDAVGPYPGDIVNCDSFTNSVAMRTYFAYYPGDPGRLDADHDGAPCEEGSGGASVNPPGRWQQFIPPYVPPAPVSPISTPTPVATALPTATPAPVATANVTLKLSLADARGFAKRYLAKRYSTFSAQTLDELDCYRQARLRVRCGVNWHRKRSFWGGKFTITRTASGLKVSSWSVRRLRY